MDFAQRSLKSVDKVLLRLVQGRLLILDRELVPGDGFESSPYSVADLLVLQLL